MAACKKVAVLRFKRKASDDPLQIISMLLYVMINPEKNYILSCKVVKQLEKTRARLNPNQNYFFKLRILAYFFFNVCMINLPRQGTFLSDLGRVAT